MIFIQPNLDKLSYVIIFAYDHHDAGKVVRFLVFENHMILSGKC